MSRVEGVLPWNVLLDAARSGDYALLRSWDVSEELDVLGCRLAHLLVSFKECTPAHAELCLDAWERSGRLQDSMGRTPLHMCASRGSPQAFAFLMEYAEKTGMDWVTETEKRGSVISYAAPRGTAFWDVMESHGWNPRDWKNGSGVGIWSFAAVSSGCSEKEYEWLMLRQVSMGSDEKTVSDLWSFSSAAKRFGIFPYLKNHGMDVLSVPLLEKVLSYLAKSQSWDSLAPDCDEVLVLENVLPVLSGHRAFKDFVDEHSKTYLDFALSSGRFWGVWMRAALASSPSDTSSLMARFVYESFVAGALNYVSLESPELQSLVKEWSLDVDALVSTSPPKRLLVTFAEMGMLKEMDVLLSLGASPSELFDSEFSLVGVKARSKLDVAHFKDRHGVSGGRCTRHGL